MRTFRAAPLASIAAAVFTLFAVAACDSGTMTGAKQPGGNTGSTLFADQITVSTFSGILSSGTSRVSILVIPGTLNARRVRVRQGDQTQEPERIVSEVASLDTGATNTLTLSLGGIQVSFDATTKFEGWRDNRDADDSAGMGEASFVSRLQAALAAGRHPTVVALRKPPAAPQGPSDSAFFAEALRLDDAADRPTIDINVTSANLTTNTTPPPDAWLTVLGRQIALDVTGGTTRIDANNRHADGALHFEGRVTAVDTGAGTATLADSTVLKVVAGTEFERPCDREDGAPLNSLAAVAAALAAGDTVDAAGQGLTVAADTLDLIEVRFRIRDNEHFQPMVVGFEGRVTSADTMSGKVILGDGTVIDVTDSTHFVTLEGGLPTLAAVMQALADTTKRVRTEGLGKPVSTTEILALFVRFAVDPDGDH
jgi:hypothetical protein